MKDKLYHYKAKVVSVYDGDTITVDIDLGFHLTTREKLRIIAEDMYFDTPEIRRSSKVNDIHKQHGLEATVRAKELLPVAQDIIIKTIKGDSFGRWLAEIWLMDGRMYATVMVEEGFQKKTKYWLDDEA